MSAWPHTDDRVIGRHLDHLRLRHPNSLVYYRQALRSFQEAVRRHQRSPRKVDRKSLEAWLRERAAHWPQSTLLHRAGIVNRFLDFLVREELIASNPIADLRAEYRARSDKAILRLSAQPIPIRRWGHYGSSRRSAAFSGAPCATISH
jgi:integrase/recombinase XerD